MNISQIGNTIVNYGLKKPIRAISETRPVEYICQNFRNDKTKFIAGIGVASIVLKDGLGCYMYVKQSLNNKKIPDDKRKFVAALDLANGGLMILTQILMFYTISNKVVQSKMFNKAFGKFFDRAAKKGYQAIINNKDKYAQITGKEFNKSFKDMKKNIEGTFGVLTSLIAATILAKRVVVPFIATPLADKAKAWMCRNDKGEQFSPDAKNSFTGSAPEAPKAPASTNLLDNYIKSK